MEKIECIWCEKPLTGLKRKFCSRSCFSKYDYQKNKKLKNSKKKKFCKWCNKPLKGLQQKFCSKDCSRKEYKYNGYEKKIYIFESHKDLIETEWDWKKNKKLGLDPNKLTCGTHKKAYWICNKNKNHKWMTSINNRTKINNTNCPYCSGRRATKKTCLKTNSPNLCKEWNYKKNKNLKPENVSYQSNKKVWWECSKGHEWEAVIYSRTTTTTNKGRNCPYCSNKKVCKDNCLSTKFPELAKEWHPTKNGKLTPENVVPGNSTKIWWQCSKKHEWRTRISERTYGSNCPYCAGQKVCKDNCLKTNFPDLCKEWNYKKNKDLKPESIVPGSGEKVWWICPKKHEWKAVIKSRTNGRNCPYCSGNKVCKDNCLSTKFPEITKEWHPIKNGKLTPENITSKNNKKVWWICSKQHEWKATISHRTNGRGCPYCLKKNEGKVKKLLSKCFKKWKIIPNKKIWHTYKNYNHRRFCDFWLEKNKIKIIVEYDGRQHYVPVCFNGISLKKAEKQFKQTQLKDKLDAEFCKENNIILHRIKYDEDKELSIKKLLEKIENINSASQK